MLRGVANPSSIKQSAVPSSDAAKHPYPAVVWLAGSMVVKQLCAFLDGICDDRLIQGWSLLLCRNRLPHGRAS